MASRFLKQFTQSFENEIVVLSGFIALDTSSNVVPTKPTQNKPSGKVYTRLLGAQKTLPVHTSAGLYTILLDDSYNSLQGVSIVCQGLDGYASFPDVKANVTGSSSPSGVEPGQDPNVAAQTVKVEFRASTGTLTDPRPVLDGTTQNGFWITLRLRNSSGN